MTARNVYLILARDVSTDTNDRMNSVHKIIDKFTAELDRDKMIDNGLTPGEAIVGIPTNYVIASSWLLEDELMEPVTLAVAITDPKGHKLSELKSESETFKPDTPRFNINLPQTVLPANSEGEYRLTVELKAGSKTIAKADYPYEVELKWRSAGTKAHK